MEGEILFSLWSARKQYPPLLQQGMSDFFCDISFPGKGGGRVAYWHGQGQKIFTISYIKDYD